MKIDCTFDPKKPLPEPAKIHSFTKHFAFESEFMPSQNYSQDENKRKIRNFSVSYIEELSQYDDFDCFVPYLAVTYFDRFMSGTPTIMREGDVMDQVKLIAASCLSIAWKIRTKSFSLFNFLNTRNINATPQQIMWIELQILNALRWRMRSLTAVCFVEYFVRFFKLRVPQFARGYILQSIITTQGYMKYTKFKPSIIAAAAFLDASSKEFPKQFGHILKMAMSCEHIEVNDLLKCMEEMGIEYKGEETWDEKDREFKFKGNEKVIDEELQKCMEEMEIENKGKGKLHEDKEFKNKGKEKVIEDPEPEHQPDQLEREPETMISEKELRLCGRDNKLYKPIGGEPSSLDVLPFESGEVLRADDDEEDKLVMTFVLNWPKFDLGLDRERGVGFTCFDPETFKSCKCSLL